MRNQSSLTTQIARLTGAMAVEQDPVRHKALEEARDDATVVYLKTCYDQHLDWVRLHESFVHYWGQA